MSDEKEAAIPSFLSFPFTHHSLVITYYFLILHRPSLIALDLSLTLNGA